jgi:hypothetical protein
MAGAVTAAMATPAAVAIMAAVTAAAVAERGGRRVVACILLAVCPAAFRVGRALQQRLKEACP